MPSLEQVEQIITLFKTGQHTCKSIGALVGYSTETVRTALAQAGIPRPNKGGAQLKFTDAQIQAAIDLRVNGRLSWGEIQEKTGINQRTIRKRGFKGVRFQTPKGGNAANARRVAKVNAMFWDNDLPAKQIAALMGYSVSSIYRILRKKRP